MGSVSFVRYAAGERGVVAGAAAKGRGCGRSGLHGGSEATGISICTATSGHGFGNEADQGRGTVASGIEPGGRRGRIQATAQITGAASECEHCDRLCTRSARLGESVEK